MEIDLTSQLEWEEEMIKRGVHRYRNQQEKAVEGKRAVETSAGSRLLKSYVLQLSEHMRAYFAGEMPNRRRSSWAKLASAVNTDAAAMFTLRHMIGSTFAESVQSFTYTANNIGMMIEDELRFSKFQTEFTEYYDEIVRQMEIGFTKDYRHKHRVLGHLSKKKGMVWREWTNEERLRVGILCIRLTFEAVDLFKIATVNRIHTIVPTDDCLDWIIRHDNVMSLASPDRMPSVRTPAPWVDAIEGGYWSPRMRHMTPLIKGTAERPRRRAELAAVEMPRVLSAINGMQDTQWRVNKEVLQIMRRAWELNLPLGMPQSQPYEIPPCPLEADQRARDLADDAPEKLAFNEWKAAARNLHNMETDRTAKLRALMRTVRIAGEMSEKDIFHYVYQCDFRGRVYSATTGLSPQGTDQSKAMLTFGRTEPLGVRGLHWLKIHGANKFGYDKTSYQDRVDWIDGQRDKWLAVAADPIGMRSMWAGCNKPWQFLAWCLDYKRATDVGPDYRSSLPVALDGSCNGLQHFSAMLRDPIGGRAVNLVPSDVPADIYQRVADVATRKLRGLAALGEQHGAATNWLNLFTEVLGTGQGMPRELSKKPVMTLPYGSTQTACTQSIFHWVYETAPQFFSTNTNFRHAIYLSPILWDSISEVVIAAREAMRWVQNASSILSKKGHPLEYTSALDFPVKQANPVLNIHRIETLIGGRVRVHMGHETDKLNVRKMRQGSSPNLIHSVDASHMMMCINEGVERGIHSYAMIHDDFGVHASRVDEWQDIIRRTFVQLHTHHDILAEFKTLHETRHDITLPDLPSKGTLDLDAVLDSPYFFG